MAVDPNHHYAIKGPDGTLYLITAENIAQFSTTPQQILTDLNVNPDSGPGKAITAAVGANSPVVVDVVDLIEPSHMTIVTLTFVNADALARNHDAPIPPE